MPPTFSVQDAHNESLGNQNQYLKQQVTQATSELTQRSVELASLTTELTAVKLELTNLEEQLKWAKGGASKGPAYDADRARALAVELVASLRENSKLIQVIEQLKFEKFQSASTIAVVASNEKAALIPSTSPGTLALTVQVPCKSSTPSHVSGSNGDLFVSVDAAACRKSIREEGQRTDETSPPHEGSLPTFSLFIAAQDNSHAEDLCVHNLQANTPYNIRVTRTLPSNAPLVFSFVSSAPVAATGSEVSIKSNWIVAEEIENVSRPFISASSSTVGVGATTTVNIDDAVNVKKALFANRSCNQTYRFVMIDMNEPTDEVCLDCVLINASCVSLYDHLISFSAP